jgi:hypothetical protein
MSKNAGKSRVSEPFVGIPLPLLRAAVSAVEDWELSDRDSASELVVTLYRLFCASERGCALGQTSECHDG